MLIRRPVLDAIAAGTVTQLFRRWDRPRVRVGGAQRTAVGVLEFTSVEPVAETALTPEDARAAGFTDLIALQGAQRGEGQLYRVGVRLAGPDPRVALRARRRLSRTDRAEIDTRLARMDRTSPHGPWTAAVLELIAENPGVRAPDLALRMGRETLPFKRDVRKLKELGLTESLEVGYRLSPRGRAYRRA
ncbi:ASCH domain-containing protein [Pseudonocardia sp. DLS-67]